jgi:prepilin-type N-terminal cleavage/methylation domain-containing protein
MSKRNGFTLVELLVVVSIIALLLAILLPALNRARQTAQGIACTTQLRQFGMAIHLYAQENNNYLPITWPGNNPQPRYKNWWSALAEYVGAEATGWQDRAVAKPARIYRCPTDQTIDPDKGVNLFSSNASYISNMLVMPHQSAMTWHPSDEGPYKLTAYRQPTARLALTEKVGEDGSNGLWLATNWGATGILNQVAYRHGDEAVGRAAVLYLDSHAAVETEQFIAEPAERQLANDEPIDPASLWGTSPPHNE